MTSKYLQRRRTSARLMVPKAKAKELLAGILERGRQLLAREVGPDDYDGYYDLRRSLQN